VTLAQQISQLPGISQVLVFGAQKFAVRVQVDPVAAAMRGIALDDVRSVLTKTNSNTPVGTIVGTSAAPPRRIGGDGPRRPIPRCDRGLSQRQPVKLGEIRQRHRRCREPAHHQSVQQ